MIWEISSSVVGSTQCRSSTTIRTGCCRARPRTWSTRCASVRSRSCLGVRPAGGSASRPSIAAMNGRATAGSAVPRRNRAVELGHADRLRVGRLEAGGEGEVPHHRPERRAGVVGRALTAQDGGAALVELVQERPNQARLPDAGLAHQQNGLALAGHRAPPSLQQERELLIAPDHRQRRAHPPGVEPAVHRSLPDHLEARERLGNALECEAIPGRGARSSRRGAVGCRPRPRRCRVPLPPAVAPHDWAFRRPPIPRARHPRRSARRPRRARWRCRPARPAACRREPAARPRPRATARPARTASSASSSPACGQPK